jgi:hypothetical protein
MNSTVAVVMMSMLIVWMIVSLGLMIYLACRYLDVIESELSGCSYVRDNRLTFSSAGLLGRVMRTCLVANMLMMPGVFVRRGVADASEILRFPRAMRVRVLVSWGGLVASAVIFVVAHNVLDFFSLPG